MNNPLFKAYGQVVEQFFVQQRVGEKISIFPAVDGRLSPNEDGNSFLATHGTPDPNVPEHVSELINQNEFKVTQNLVDHFRGVLLQERGHAQLRGPAGLDNKDGSAQTPANLVENLSRFKNAVESGDESGLQANPFYELTKLVFRHNVVSAKNLFDAMQLDLVASPPEKVNLLRSFREIWFSKARLVHGENPGILKKLTDQIDSWMGLGKVIVAVVLYFGSSFTTGRGVNDILQSPDISLLAGGLFDGREAEFLRYSIALTIAVLLSSAILDFKDRLFRSMAEEGKVWRGIRYAVLRNPCWMILAIFLTAISVKTNYDGIVSIISKKADLAKQSEQIRSRVKRALGSTFFVNTIEPNDLYDLQGILHSSTMDSIEKFQRVPDDEVSGVASSGDPRKGPRYWGKYFIVNGGYEPGVQDVVHAYQNIAFSVRIDDMLRASGLDLKTALADKIETLRRTYDDHLSQTADRVDHHLQELNGLMEMRGYSLEEIKRVFALEHYQINDIVLSMAQALEENKKEYERIAAELNALTDAYVGVLQEVDKSGAATRKEYHIEGKLAIPDIDAIKELKNTKIPRATHKSFAELKAFLIEEHGLALVNGLLFGILFISFCMDLLDPLIYSRWTAMIGRQDKRMFPDLMEYLREWENDFVVGCHQFFCRRDVQQIFKGIPFPNRTGVRNAFYLLLESINPLLKDSKDQTFFQDSFDWFKGLFRLTRTSDMRGYNQRAEAIGRFVENKDLYFRQFIEYVFPGVKLEKGLGSDPFFIVMKKTETGQAQHREVFAWELKVVAGRSVDLPTVATSAGDSWDEQKELSSALMSLEHKRQGMSKFKGGLGTASQENNSPEIASPDPLGPRIPVAVTLSAEILKTCLRPENSVAHNRWKRLFRCALLPPLGSFPHTRRRWLQEIAKQDGRSFEEMDGLYDFMPDLKETLLVTLPKIRKEVLGPLEEIRTRFPERCVAAQIISDKELEEKFAEIEKESLQILGLSPAMGDQTRLYAPIAGIELELEGISRDVLDHVGGDSMGFNGKVAALVQLADDALLKAKTIKDSTVQEMTQILKDVKRFHESTKQILLKINMSGSESRKARLPPRDLLRLLRHNKDILEQAPQRSEAILRTMQQIFNAKEPYTEAAFKVLKKLYEESRQVYEEVRDILVMIQGVESIPHLELTEFENRAMVPLVEESSMEEPLFSFTTDPTSTSEESVYGRKPAPEQDPIEEPIEEKKELPVVSELVETEEGWDSSERDQTLLTYSQEEENQDDTSPVSMAMVTEVEEENSVVLETDGLDGAEETEQEDDLAESYSEEEQWADEEAELVFASASGAAAEDPVALDGTADGQLIPVAQFSQIYPEGGSPGIVSPAPSRAERLRKLSALRWGEQPETPVTPDMVGIEIPIESKAETVIAVAPILKRETSEASLDFKTKDGLHFRGASANVSLDGLKLAPGMNLSHLKEQKKGRLQLVSAAGTHQFPCEVVHCSEAGVTLKLFAGHHQFAKEGKEKIFEDLQRDHQILIKEHQTMVSNPLLASGSKRGKGPDR